jgi:flagellar basal body rod protein FlgB
VERTHFAQNAMMMQAAIEFFSSGIKSRLQAISGQPG